MNVQLKWCAAVLLGSVMAVGCGEDTDTTTPPPGATPTTPQATAEDAADATAASAEDASDQLKSSADAGADAAKARAEQASDAVKSGAEDAADAAANNPAVAQAQTQVQQVMTYIKENKLDAAETALQQLEKNKASLPTAIQPQVDNARKMLNAAKATGSSGTAAPSLPAAPAAPAQ